MEEQLINFETAKLAKEKGCYLNSFYYFDNGKLTFGSKTAYAYQQEELGLVHNCTTQSLLQKWLRDIHNIVVTISVDDNVSSNCYYIHTNIKQPFSNRICSLPRRYNLWEEALEVGLQEALELI